MKRWWKSGDDPAAAAVRSTRKRLRSAYRASRDAAVAGALRAANERIATETERLEAFKREISSQNLRLAAEVARATLRFNPSDFTSRWTLYVTFSESFMANAHDLSHFGPYVLEVLCAAISGKVREIDFARIKPVAFVVRRAGSPRADFPLFEVSLDPTDIQEAR